MARDARPTEPLSTDDPATRRMPTTHDRDGDGVDDRVEHARSDEADRVHRPDVDRTDDLPHDTADDRVHDTGGRPVVAARPVDRARERKELLGRQREAFGGIKVGAAFFGWLTATGMAVLLTALVAAAGTAVGLATDTDVAAVTSRASQDPGTVGVVGAVALGVVLFLSYYCGGYVAGRMARFAGAKQGVAVWLWAVLVAVVAAVAGAVAGSRYDVLARLDSLPRIPVNEGDVTTGGLVAVAVVAVVSLLAAVVGGLAGMRYHRRVDRADLEPLDDASPAPTAGR